MEYIYTEYSRSEMDNLQIIATLTADRWKANKSSTVGIVKDDPHRSGTDVRLPIPGPPG